VIYGDQHLNRALTIARRRKARASPGSRAPWSAGAPPTPVEFLLERDLNVVPADISFDTVSGSRRLGDLSRTATE
jgi:hypothetical protein